MFTIIAPTPALCDTEPHSVLAAEDYAYERLESTIGGLPNAQVTINWNGIVVPLDYKYDIGVMLYEIVEELVLPLTNSNTGSIEITWPSDTFRANWRVAWTLDEVRINADWHSVQGGAQTLNHLRKHPKVRASFNDFLSGWQQILRHLAQIVSDAGSRCEQTEFWERLLRAAAAQRPAA